MTIFFNHNYLNLEKFKKPIYIYNRSLVILEEYISNKFKVYNGKNFIDITVSNDMVGYRFGEFINSRKKHKYVKKKKKK